MCWYCNASWLLVAQERFSRLSPRMEKASWCTRSSRWRKSSHEAEPWNSGGAQGHRYVNAYCAMDKLNYNKFHCYPLIWVYFSIPSVKSFVEIMRYLLKLPGVTGHYFLSERLSQDHIEKYFGRQRARGGRSDNPTVKACVENAQSLRVQGSFAL